jgi:hypothetical protein
MSCDRSVGAAEGCNALQEQRVQEGESRIRVLTSKQRSCLLRMHVEVIMQWVCNALQEQRVRKGESRISVSTSKQRSGLLRMHVEAIMQWVCNALQEQRV